INYPDYLTLAFNQAAPNPNPDPTSTQWDALTVVRKTIGQALGFTLNYVDSAGNLGAGNKWTDHVTITGSNAVFDETPGGLNIPLAATTGAGEQQFADPSGLMGQGELATGRWRWRRAVPPRGARARGGRRGGWVGGAAECGLFRTPPGSCDADRAGRR